MSQSNGMPRISHAEAEQWISARLDAPLPHEQNRILLAHLSTCPSCRAFASRVESMSLGLRSLPMLPASPTVSRQVRERIAEGQSPWTRFRRIMLSGPWGAMPAMASALILVAAVTFSLILRGDNDTKETPGVAASATQLALSQSATPTSTDVPETAVPTRTPYAERAQDDTNDVVNVTAPTFTPTATETDVPTAEPTLTATPTVTETDVPTQEPSATPSYTPTASETAASEPTETPEPPTETPTDQPTAEPSATPSETATETPTETETPKPTATDEPTETPTATPSNTPDPTETNTPKPTRTPTDEPTETPQPTETNTPKPTRTPTDEPTETPTPTETNTPKPTRTPTDEPTETPTPTETNTPKPTRTPTDEPTETQPAIVPRETEEGGNSTQDVETPTEEPTNDDSNSTRIQQTDETAVPEDETPTEEPTDEPTEETGNAAEPGPLDEADEVGQIGSGFQAPPGPLFMPSDRGVLIVTGPDGSLAVTDTSGNLIVGLGGVTNPIWSPRGQVLLFNELNNGSRSVGVWDREDGQFYQVGAEPEEGGPVEDTAVGWIGASLYYLRVFPDNEGYVELHAADWNGENDYLVWTSEGVSLRGDAPVATLDGVLIPTSDGWIFIDGAGNESNLGSNDAGFVGEPVLSPFGSLVAYSVGLAVYVADVTTPGSPQAVLDYPDGVSGFAFSPTGEEMVVSDGETLRIYSIADGSLISEASSTTGAYVGHLSWGEEGIYFLEMGDVTTLKLIQPEDFE